MYLIKVNTEVDKLIVNNCLYTFCFRFDVTVQNTTAIFGYMICSNKVQFALAHNEMETRM